MVTKTVILTPAGVTVPNLGADKYTTFPMPDNSDTECIVPWQGGVPIDFSSLSMVELIIKTETTGNIFLNGSTTRFDAATMGIVQSSSATPYAYDGGLGDSKSKFISIPSTMWSSLTAINPGDILTFTVERDATNVSDTYSADLNVIGLRITYVVGYVAGNHYCSQTDLEYRISTLTLARLTNDTAGSTTPDANTVELILTNVDAIIDAKAGQVYTVPFTTVPDIVKNIAISLAAYQVFQRRPVNMLMPPDWQKAHDEATQQLEDISNMLLRLPDTATIASAESNMVTPTTDPPVDFYNSNNDMSQF